MNAELKSFLSRYNTITDEMAAAFNIISLLQEFPKGSVLLREGDRINYAYFLLKGCIRSYVLRDGEDRTIDFFIEEEAVIPIGYGNINYASHFLECLEDTVVVVSTPDLEEKTLTEHPQLKEVCLAMSEVMARKLQVALARYKTSSPEERYGYLVEKRPELPQRIPQYHVASCLGVRPESLSRIRKRISPPPLKLVVVLIVIDLDQ